jgi:hypothetical protein
MQLRICSILTEPAVLYECEIWPLTLWEEHIPRGFENRALGMFEPKRDEVIGNWRKLHNEELHNSYAPVSSIKVIK